ncbi:hypothetical protein KFD70_15675 [Bacillus pfraonensis]|uniref:hypothetical protein n=1 Tax=Bacillus TaxID=1386 RepID=UPI002A5101B4|nr:hypothetical protein [Bacillus pseudomycoides]
MQQFKTHKYWIIYTKRLAAFPQAMIQILFVLRITLSLMKFSAEGLVKRNENEQFRYCSFETARFHFLLF